MIAIICAVSIASGFCGGLCGFFFAKRREKKYNEKHIYDCEEDNC